MRTLLRVTIPVDSGNAAFRNGSLQKIIAATVERLKPEAAYFFPDGGARTAMFVFDMKDSSDIVKIAEPLFEGLEASVEFFPVMNAEDLQKGMAAL
jgi:hypothetical protein